jgi:hypothetical protein
VTQGDVESIYIIDEPECARDTVVAYREKAEHGGSDQPRSGSIGVVALIMAAIITVRMPFINP